MIIIADLEATCWKNKKLRSEIIEIGAVKLNNKLEIIDEFDEFVKPYFNPELSDFCKKLTSIKQEDINYARVFPLVFVDFVKWAGKVSYFCSWGNYDKKQLIRDCNLHNLKIPKFIEKRHINVKEIFAKAYDIKPKGLGKAIEKIGKTFVGTHHRGIDDARNIAVILMHLNEVKLSVNNKRIEHLGKKFLNFIMKEV